MRVLMTADAVGGVWTYALELARALAPRGVRVTLAVMGPPPSAEQRVDAERLLNVDLRVAPYKLEWMADPWKDVDAAGDWLLGIEAEQAPDVVHLNGYAHAAFPWRAPALVVAHSCVLSWWRAVHGERAPPEWDAYRAAVARGLRAAARVAAPTAAMLATLRRDYGYEGGGVVIPNALDPARFRVAPKEPFVLSAGRLWDEAKNLATLDEAAADAPWPVLVAGDDAHPDGHRASARHAKFLGRLSSADLRDRYARAAVFALPARYEPFGLSALEAAHSGCALVLGDVPSLREVWGDAALFVPPDDARALSAALRRLAEDDRIRDDYAARARARAARFSPAAMAAGYWRLYERLSRTPHRFTLPPPEDPRPCAS